MVLVFLESKNGKIKKSSFEAASFASDLASKLNLSLSCLVPKGSDGISELGLYGIDQHIEITVPDYLDSQQWTEILAQICTKLNPAYFVLSNNSLGKSIGGRLDIKWNKGLISNAVEVKMEGDKPKFRKNVFSGKANAWYGFSEKSGIISVMPHGYGVFANQNKTSIASTIEFTIPEARVKLRERNLMKGKTPLTEADIVVSAGRGLKDPSNWGMIEELAEILNATTACSRPVADAGWRPHHEHVGQTGIAIRPNVYIAIGISGAIQHLAGVNNSKNIIVINKDPEAPFFKAADYGVCGDLFEVIPKLNVALKKAKSH